MLRVLITIFILTMPLAGCLGVTEETDGIVSFERLVGYLKQSNTTNGGHVDLGGLAQRGTVRFDTTSSIPIYYVSQNGESVPNVIVETIEIMRNQLKIDFVDVSVLDHELSQYRDTSYPTENIGNYSFNRSSFQSTHGIGGGIVFAVGTAYFDKNYSDSPGNMCANASISPYDGGMIIEVDDNTHTFKQDTLLWVNLGNGQCDWDKSIVLHEMAHALGLFNHFDYFGSWNSTAMATLKLLYKNNPGTPFDSLTP